VAIDAGGERRPGTVDGRLQAMARDYGGDERAASRGPPDGDLSVRRGGGGIRSHSYYFYLTAPT